MFKRTKRGAGEGAGGPHTSAATGAVASAFGLGFLIGQAEQREEERKKKGTLESILKQGYQPVSREVWLSDWFNLTAQFQQQIANQLQAESRFFYRRGILPVLEGDVLGREAAVPGCNP